MAWLCLAFNLSFESLYFTIAPCRPVLSRSVWKAHPPQATVFQAAFCLLLYNMVQVLRGYIATAQPQPCLAEEVSAEH
jgi:hypothetical protein